MKTEAYGIEGEADRVGTVQPGRKKTWGGLIQMHKHLTGGEEMKTEPDSALCKGSRYSLAILCFHDAVCVGTAT